VLDFSFLKYFNAKIFFLKEGRGKRRIFVVEDQNKDCK